MTIKYRNTDIQRVVFRNVDIEKVVYRNVTVFESAYKVNIVDQRLKQFNLWQYIGQSMPAQKVIEVNINSESLIGGIMGQPTIPAFRLGNSFTGKTIVINNDGRVFGAAGLGAIATLGGSPDNGGNAGNAFDFSEANGKIVTLNNTRAVYAGGGGGGSGEDVRDAGNNGKTGGNGGNGAGGDANGDFEVSQRGGPRQDFVSPINGRRGNSGNGGDGGDFGEDGNEGLPGLQNFLFNKDAGQGGRKGYAIYGISNCNLNNTGSIFGDNIA